MREGDAEQAEAALPGAVQKLVGADGASAKEDQGECPDELRDELLGLGVHRAPPETAPGRSSSVAAPAMGAILLKCAMRVKSPRRRNGQVAGAEAEVGPEAATRAQRGGTHSACVRCFH